VKTQFKTTFNLNRLLDGDFVASKCRINVEFSFNDVEPSRLGHETRLKAMKYWVEEILNQSVAYYIGTECNTEIFESIGNHLVFCPEEPDDYLMALLIHAKLKAIGSKYINVESVKFETDTSMGFNHISVGDPLEDLPTIDNWMGEKRFFNRPWWDRDDGSMIDVYFEEGDDLAKKPDILIEILAQFMNKVPIKNEDKTAEIIRPNFRLVTNKD
jgi:hypothetical protein